MFTSSSAFDRPPAFGAWTMTANPVIVEALCKPKPDFLGVDLQHGYFGFPECLQAIQIANLMDVTVFVRLSILDLALIPRVLDHGADGVIDAMIETARDALQAVSAATYQPLGTRSYGGSRYGLLPEPADPRDRMPAVFAMIETRSAFEQIEDIAKTPRLEGLFVGPVDLGLATGAVFPPHSSAEWQANVISVAQAAQAAGLRSGTFAVDGADAAHWAEAGFDAVVVSSEIAVLDGAMRSELNAAGQRQISARDSSY